MFRPRTPPAWMASAVGRNLARSRRYRARLLPPRSPHARDALGRAGVAVPLRSQKVPSSAGRRSRPRYCVQRFAASSGIRTRDRLVISRLLFPTELWSGRQESNLRRAASPRARPLSHDREHPSLPAPRYAPRQFSRRAREDSRASPAVDAFDDESVGALARPTTRMWRMTGVIRRNRTDARGVTARCTAIAPGPPSKLAVQGGFEPPAVALTGRRSAG